MHPYDPVELALLTRRDQDPCSTKAPVASPGGILVTGQAQPTSGLILRMWEYRREETGQGTIVSPIYIHFK